MLNKDELLILAEAAIDGDGEYSVQRDWNKPWGADYRDMKTLEDQGFMKIKSAGRAPLGKQYVRRSGITDAGRAALAESIKDKIIMRDGLANQFKAIVNRKAEQERSEALASEANRSLDGRTQRRRKQQARAGLSPLKK